MCPCPLETQETHDQIVGLGRCCIADSSCLFLGPALEPLCHSQHDMLCSLGDSIRGQLRTFYTGMLYAVPVCFLFRVL